MAKGSAEEEFREYISVQMQWCRKELLPGADCTVQCTGGLTRVRWFPAQGEMVSHYFQSGMTVIPNVSLPGLSG
jgi:hypothetical protein